MALRPNFKKTVFANGLTLLSERHSEYRSLSIGVWVKVGTRHERPHEAGASHFLEHMLFKGTKNRSALDIAREVDRVGGDFNAFTAREYTCFHLLLLGRDIELGLDILSDIILNSDFNAEEMERERKVILQEIAMVEESPEELAHDLFSEYCYKRHGLGRPILGTERSIKKMKRGELVRFFKKHYRPDQLVISVSGNIKHDQLKRKLKGLSRGRWHKGPGVPEDGPVLEKPVIQSGRWWVERPTEQVHLVWGVEGPTYASRDRFAAFLLNVYLGGGMSSSLFQEIREKNGLAYTVYSSLSPYKDSGMFSIYAATGMAQIPLCLRLIEECVSKLQRDLLSEEELLIIKDNMKGTIQLSSDSVESRMSSIAKNEIFFGQYYGVDEVCKMVDQVTPQDIRRVARKLLRDGKRSILALGPKPSRTVRKKFNSI
jgi:predicted Zn-dependent peptidase